MSSFEQPISQLEAALTDAERALESIENVWMDKVLHWPTESTYHRLNDALVAAIKLANYRRKALKRAKKAAGKVSDTFATMSAEFSDESSERPVTAQDLLDLLHEFVATARKSGLIIGEIRYDSSLVGDSDS